MPFRRKTVEALMRQNARERDELIGVIREQNDRLMYLAGRTWALPPPEPFEEDETDKREESFPDATQLVEDQVLS